MPEHKVYQQAGVSLEDVHSVFFTLPDFKRVTSRARFGANIDEQDINKTDDDNKGELQKGNENLTTHHEPTIIQS